MLSDFWPHGEVAQLYGVFRPEGHSERAIFIIDQEGIVRYIDIHDIDDQPSNAVLFAELKRIDPGMEAILEEQTTQEDELPQGGVVMYCTSWCPDCKRARAWLKKHQIEYTEIDIDHNSKAEQQVRQWANGNRTTPTFDINGAIVVDFEVERLSELLNIKL